MAITAEMREKYRKDVSAWVQQMVMRIALSNGEFHPDDLLQYDIEDRRVITSRVSYLVKSGLMIKSHRTSTSKQTRKTTPVYVLTPKGMILASVLALSATPPFPVLGGAQLQIA